MDLSEFLKGLIKSIREGKITTVEKLLQEIEKVLHVEMDTPVEDFCGITPYKMMRLLYYPFESPDVVTFITNIPPPLDAPFVRLFILLLNGIHEAGGLKATAKGYLPRDFCREIEKRYYSEEGWKLLGRERFPLLKEVEFLHLHKVRVLASMAGYIGNYKKRFVLRERGKKVVKNGFTMEDYFHLFKTYVWKYNWAYYDFYEEVELVQTSFLFTLYLLQIFGHVYRPKRFYAEKFLTAFPEVLEQFQEDAEWGLEPENQIKDIYIRRAINEFALGWGFAESPERADIPFTFIHDTVRKKDFLDRFIKFW